MWKLHRIRAMGAAEVVYRLRLGAKASLERIAGSHPRIRRATGTSGRPWIAEFPSEVQRGQYRAGADRILAGCFDVFALRDARLGFPPAWNRDPKTGRTAPVAFGKTLDYRDETLVGDIKYLWEPNRHLELVTLAQAWHFSRERKYADGCRVLLSSWFEQCPYLLGPNWTSSLEHGVRLLNWAVAWHLLGHDGSPLFDGQDGATFRCAWQDMIYLHCYFIAGHLSRYSSANNHLLGELMGLLVGSLTWPLWPESERWCKEASREFECQALVQTGEDGVNREQALWYHHEVADMMLLVGLFARANGVEFSSQYWLRLEAMLGFIADVMNISGQVPMFGDSDDAVILRLSSAPDFNVFRSLLATGSVLFGRPDFASKAGHFDEKSRWVLGDEAAKAFDVILGAQESTAPIGSAGERRHRRHYPDGGYYILGDNFDSPSEVKLVADAGPLGYLSIAAHGHADALAFTLSVYGQELLIDPGTYSYHTQKKWRDYFRGTSAHNTVRVDGQDQSVIAGNFLWLQHARVECERWESTADIDLLVATHDGYRRLRYPLIHRREILFEKASRSIRVTDRLETNGPHEVEVMWHFAEECKVTIESQNVTVKCGRVVIEHVMLNDGWEPVLVVGQNDPPLGWVSRRFDEKVPSPTLLWRGKIHGSETLICEFHVRELAGSAIECMQCE